MPHIHDDYLSAHRKENLKFRNATVFGDNSMIRQSLEAYATGKNSWRVHLLNTFLPFEDPKECNPDGIHSMARARWEAEGFVHSLTWLNEGEVTDVHVITPGQVFCFGMFCIVFFIVLFGELALSPCSAWVLVGSTKAKPSPAAASMDGHKIH